MFRPIHVLFKNVRETDILEKALSILLEHGADINAKDKYGCTALTIEAGRDCPENVKLLLKYGADITCEDGLPLINAECAEIVQVLLGAGMDINHVTRNGKTALSYHCLYSEKDVIELLINRGADVNLGESKGCTPLIGAINNGRIDIVELLLRAPNIDVNKKNSYGRAPLVTAVELGSYEITSMLLKSGADIGCLTDLKMSPLELSCYNPRLFHLLLQFGTMKWGK